VVTVGGGGSGAGPHTNPPTATDDGANPVAALAGGRWVRWRPALPVALRQRQFRLYFVGQTGSVLGDDMVPVALSFAVLDRFHTASALGTVLAAETGPLALTLLAGGVIADRVSRRWLLLSMDVVRAVVMAIAAVLLFVGGWQLWQLSVLFAVQGAASGLASPALIGLVADTVEPLHRQQANSLRGLSTALGGVIGPALAGILAGFGSGGLALAVNGGSYVVSAVCMAAMAPTPAASEDSRASYLSELRSGWREFRSRTWVWVCAGQFSLFHMLVYAPVIVLGALVSKRSLGGATAWGTTLAALGVGALLGALVMLRYHPRRPLLVATASTIPFAAWALALGLIAPEWCQVVAAAASGMSLGVYGTLWDTALTTHVPADMLSRVSAYDSFGSWVLEPVGYALVGVFVAALGVRGTLYMAAIVWTVLVAAVLCVPAVTGLRAVTAGAPTPRAEPAPAGT